MGPQLKLTHTKDINDTVGQARSVLSLFAFAEIGTANALVHPKRLFTTDPDDIAQFRPSVAQLA